MNREELIKKFDKDTGYFIDTPIEVLHLARFNFILLIEKIQELKKENIRLKKQLASNHHIECSCSFCKPVVEINKLNCNKCKHYYTEYKFDLLFDKCKLEKCNWELKC